ncbi:MAG: TonB-dependent receptor [Caulobacteraceae bacterium]|nr:TonB-dependent receptor [Caulobacteraceae bacterium]
MSTLDACSRAMVMGGASIIALSVFSAAQAQQAPAQAGTKTASTEVTEVVVTGYRASLQTALDTKRKSILPIESIAPEDIGKMPDQNVAEALQRLPGIQIDRTQGQGTTVLIDGLRQNLTTLNGDLFLTGKEFSVSGENSNAGSGAGNQYGSLEGIPSEEISGIDVYKNPQASMNEGGLGGTIDLKLRDPLSGPDGLQIGGNLRATTAQGESSWTPVGAIVITDKLSDRFAITGSFSYDAEDTHTKEFQDENRSSWVITNSSTGPNPGTGANATPTVMPNGQYYIDPQLAYFTDQYDKRKTLGASLGLAWKVTDSITTRLNWFYSREDDTEISYSDKVWFNGQGDASGSTTMPGIDASQPYSISSNGVVQNATFSANGAETATNYFHNITEANNFQWITKYDPDGPLKADFGVFYSRADSNFQADQADIEHGLYNTAGGVATSPSAPGCNNGADSCNGGNPGYQFKWNSGGTSGLPSVSYLSNILNNPAYVTFKSNWAWANFTAQKQWAVKGDLHYKADFMPAESVFSAGFRIAERDVDQTFGRYLINGTLANGDVTAGPIGVGEGPWLYYQDPGYSNGNGINVPYSTAASNPGLVKVVNNFGAGQIIVKSTSSMTDPSTYLNKIWAAAGVPNQTEKFFVDGLSSFQVKETTYAGYLMGDVGGPADRFHLNFGVRVVDTHLDIDNGQAAQSPTYYGTASWNGVDSNVVAVQTRRDYIDVLPSLNFVYNLTETQKLRLDAARVMSPQDLFSLGLGNSYGFTRQGSGSTYVFDGGSSGNAKLDPYRATQVDASWEDYFARGGLISVAGFYKSIDSFVETENVPTTVDGTTANVSQPVNGGSGYIYGVEVGVQYAFDGSRFWSGLKGFGVAANYTRSESSSQQLTAFSTTGPIPGVSKDSLTVTGYYERGGFSARASYSWRDKSINDSSVGSTFAFNDQNGHSKVYQVYAAPYGQLDAQIGYDFTKRIGVVFSVQNITDAAQHTYLQWPDLPFTYDDWGRRYFLGVKFKF